MANINNTIARIVSEKQDVLLSLNRDQMLLGRNSDGNTFTPGYLDDPYFKSDKQARAYANMKYKLESEHNALIENPTIFPRKNRDTPNLIVTGPFQNNMFIRVDADRFLIGSTYNDSDEIENKYEGLVFGLAPESKEFFYEKYIKFELIKMLNESNK